MYLMLPVSPYCHFLISPLVFSGVYVVCSLLIYNLNCNLWDVDIIPEVDIIPDVDTMPDVDIIPDVDTIPDVEIIPDVDTMPDVVKC